MIEAKDLRIANWVKMVIATGGTSIEQINGAYIRWIEIGDASCEPIPLTPEVLEKCGFALQPKKQCIYIKGRLKLWLGHNGAIAYLRNEDTDESYFIPNNPQSLHQLQNLYYSLTGEELEISL